MVFKPKHKQCLSRQFFLSSFTVWPVWWNEQNSPGDISPWSCCISLILNYQPSAHQTFLQQLPNASWLSAHLRLCSGQSLLWSSGVDYFYPTVPIPLLALRSSCQRALFFPQRLQSDFHLGALTPFHMDRICAMTLLPVYRTVRELNAHMGEPGWKQIISDWCFYWLQWGFVFVFHHCVGVLYHLYK